MKTALLAFTLLGCLATAAQQGKNSASLGIFFSLPLEETKYKSLLEPGIGAEFTFEPRLSDRSAILIQGAAASYKYKEKWLYHEDDNIKIFSLKVGYRYYFKPAGFYVNASPGVDYYTDLEPMALTVTAGAGKRFLLSEKHFVDAGIDYIDGNTEKRMHVKVAFGVFPKRKKTIIVK